MNVQVPKSIHYLLHALTSLTRNSHHLPVSASIVGPMGTGAAAPTLQVTVTDVLGQALPKGVTVVADSIQKEGGAQVGAALPLNKESETLFSLNVMELKPERGFYTIVITAKGKDARLVGN